MSVSHATFMSYLTLPTLFAPNSRISVGELTGLEKSSSAILSIDDIYCDKVYSSFNAGHHFVICCKAKKPVVWKNFVWGSGKKVNYG